MKKSRGKGRRNFNPSADGRYTTIVCTIMASEKTRTAKAARYEFKEQGWCGACRRAQVRSSHHGDEKIMKQRHYQQYLARKRKREREKAFALGWEFAEMANCPIHECLVPQGLFEEGIGNLIFSRRLPDGRIALGMFLLDVFCLGVKNAFSTTLSTTNYEQRIHDWRGPETLKPTPPACLRKLVEGGVAYARELGFNPHPDYAVTSQIFGDVDASACSTEFN